MHPQKEFLIIARSKLSFKFLAVCTVRPHEIKLWIFINLFMVLDVIIAPQLNCWFWSMAFWWLHIAPDHRCFNFPVSSSFHLLYPIQFFYLVFNNEGEVPSPPDGQKVEGALSGPQLTQPEVPCPPVQMEVLLSASTNGLNRFPSTSSGKSSSSLISSNGKSFFFHIW